mmetsp:Transcript_25322/g.46229  ORF Transcript_25322/g.46229 Transcript_25322/m.46229 type:complete len:129 (-) Transcript_25322:78-464(-)
MGDSALPGFIIIVSVDARWLMLASDWDPSLETRVKVGVTGPAAGADDAEDDCLPKIFAEGSRPEGLPSPNAKISFSCKSIAVCGVDTFSDRFVSPVACVAPASVIVKCRVPSSESHDGEARALAMTAE